MAGLRGSRQRAESAASGRGAVLRPWRRSYGRWACWACSRSRSFPSRRRC